MEREAVVEALAGLHDEVVDGVRRQAGVEEGDDVALVGGEGDLELGVGLDLESRGAGHEVLRYRSCRAALPNPSTPASGGSCATSSRSSGPTLPPSVRGGPPPTWPPTWWCGSATPPPRRASSSAAPSPPAPSGSWTKAKASGLPRAGGPRPQRSTVRTVRGAGAPHPDQPPGVRGAPRGRAPGQRARAAHRPSRPRRGRSGATCGAGHGFLLRKVHGATVGLQRPGGDVISTGHGPEVLVTGEPVDLLLYLFGREAAAQVEITGDPGAQATLAEAPPVASRALEGRQLGRGTTPRLRRPLRPSHSTAKSTSVARSSPESRWSTQSWAPASNRPTTPRAISRAVGEPPHAAGDALDRARGAPLGSPGAGATQPPPSRSRPPRCPARTPGSGG